MKQEKARNNSIENQKNLPELGHIGNISISCGWENDQTILILNNRGSKEEQIKIWYKEDNFGQWHQFKIFQLSDGDEYILQLPKEYEVWKKLGFEVGTKRGSELVSNLKKLLDTVKRQTNIKNPFPERSQPSTEIPTNLIDEKQNQHKTDLQSQITQINIRLKHTVTEFKMEIENLKKQNVKLSRENSNNKAVLDGLASKISADPKHIFHEAASHVLQIIFTEQKGKTGGIFQLPSQICDMIKVELDRFKEQFNVQENYTLSTANQRLIKAKRLTRFELSEMLSPDKFMENQPRDLAEIVLTNEPPEDIRFTYFEVLYKAYWEDLKAYASKLPYVIAEVQSILDQTIILLVEGFSPDGNQNPVEVEMSHSFYEHYLPNILRVVGLELVPIEIGRTEADARFHEIRGTQRCAFKPGVVANILQHGLRRISDQKIIKKPVVMRGEPE